MADVEEKKEVTPEVDSSFEDFGTIKVATDLDFKALKHYNMFMMKGKRHSTVISFVCSFALIGLGLFMAITYILNVTGAVKSEKAPSPMNIVLASLAVIFGIYSLISAIRMEKNTDKSIANYFDHHAVMHQICEFEGDAIYLHKRNELRKEPYDWSYVTEIDRTPDYYFLMVNRQTPIIISRDPEMMKEGTKEDLDRLMDSRGAARPYKKFDTNFCKLPITYVQTFVEEEAPMEEAPVDHVKEVEQKIDALPIDVELSDEEAIKDARVAFDALADEDQYKIKNYVKLAKAEKALAEKALAEPKQD